MPEYEYQAVTASGRLMKGFLQAESSREAVEVLRGMALTVNSLREVRPARPAGPIGRNEFILFNQQLAAIARAGIPLERSLRELASEATSDRLRRLILAIADDLEAGEGIETAFERRKEHFPPLYGRVLAAGVRTGRLGEMLMDLNRHLLVGQQTRRILFEAVCYPAVVLAFAVVVATMLFAVVVPRFKTMFDLLNVRKPALTRAVFFVSDNIAALWVGLGAAVVFVVLVSLLLSRWAEGRRFKERLVLSLPVLGRLFRNSVLARLADAMAVLVSAGTDLPACFRLGAETAGSELLRQDGEAVARRIEQGVRLYDAGAGCELVPPLFFYSMEWGAHRGELGDSLHGLAEMYGQQVAAHQGRLKAVLMPVLILLVGVMVGLTVLCLITPLVQWWSGLIVTAA